MAAPARLLWPAEPLLTLATQLRATGTVADIGLLRTNVVAMLRNFQESLRHAGCEAARAGAATEVLAALIDHIVSSMPWGVDSGWQPLAARSQGKRPAERVLDVARSSASDADMKELIAVVLELGFDRRSRGPDDQQIERLLQQLTTREPSAAPDPRLSPDTQSKIARQRGFTSWLPLWVSGLAVAALLAALFFGLELSLAAKSDRAYARLATLDVPKTRVRHPRPAASPRLAGALADQAAAHDVFVQDEIDRSVIVISDGKLFEPGSPTLRADSARVLGPIAAALKRVPGRTRIVDHTDGTAAHSARYPSDWELSVDRAIAIRDALTNLGMDGSRLAYDGRASIEPLGADDRARAVSGNGRVELTLLVGR